MTYRILLVRDRIPIFLFDAFDDEFDTENVYEKYDEMLRDTEPDFVWQWPATGRVEEDLD